MASKYSPIPEHSDEFDRLIDGTSIKRRNWTLWIAVLACLCGTLFGAGSTLAIETIINTHSNQYPNHGSYGVSKDTSADHDVNEYYGLVVEPVEYDPVCGNNRHEAKQNGCKYDVMASRWYPEECFHGDVLEQMLKEVEFDWFWDSNHTQPTTWETALAGEFDQLYPLHDYHIMHCLYQFRRLHMAVIEHRQIDDDAYSYGHTVHCTKLIMQWPLEWKYGKNTTTKSPSGMAYCIPPFL